MAGIVVVVSIKKNKQGRSRFWNSLFYGSSCSRTEIWEQDLKENKELYSIFFFFSGKHTEANFSFLIKLTQSLTLANVTTTHFQ